MLYDKNYMTWMVLQTAPFGSKPVPPTVRIVRQTGRQTANLQICGMAGGLSELPFDVYTLGLSELTW